MTNEQREAIDRLNKDKNRPLACGDITVVNIADIDTALLLIQEQQEEIEGLKNKEVLIKRYFKKCDLIKQKDKQIDLMANCILAREIGKMTCQFNEKCTKYENGRDIHCKDCIKQYFERKVEDVKD